jgi:hypothetical protein
MDSNAQHLDREKITRILKDINKAWTEGNPDDLNEFFHEDMVIAQPGYERMAAGKIPCVESYKIFASSAKVLSFKESEPLIDIWGDTAAASYIFDLDYETKGKSYSDTGIDMFIFIRTEGKWKAVWRTIIPLPCSP